MDKDDKEAIVSLLLELISIVSLSGTEDEIAAYIVKKLQELSLPFYEKKGNIYTFKGNPDTLIATHIDTVPSWQHESAFKPYYDGERVWGRGAVDTKGQIASLLYAMRHGKNFFVAFLRDEEEGGSGSEEIELPNTLDIKGCIVLEPTSFNICTCQAGSIELEVYTKGKSVHGAVPKKGKNAIEIAIEVFQAIKRLFRYEDPFFPDSGVNLGVLQGGTDCQVVPKECLFKIDIPVLPKNSTEDVLKKLRHHLKNMPDVEYRILEKSEPWSISQDEWIVKKLQRAYERALKEKPSFSGMPAWTDASNIREKGLPCIVFGAGDLSCAHTPYESIHKQDLFKLFLVIEKLME